MRDINTFLEKQGISHSLLEAVSKVANSTKQLDESKSQLGVPHSAILKKYHENEEINNHTENLVMLSRHFGSDQDRSDANELKSAHMKRGYLDHNLSNEFARLHKKLSKHLSVKEDVENLDELSKQTLGAYIKKAAGDVDTKRDKIKGSFFRNNDKIISRENKIDLAMRKRDNKCVKIVATEDTEQLDELSKKTLGVYIRAAHHDSKKLDRDAVEFSKLGWDARKDGDEQGAGKMWSIAGKKVVRSANRDRGIDRASRKMQKESVEIMSESNHIHVYPHETAKNTFVVHSVGKKVDPDHVKLGDHLRSSDLDDLTDGGYHVKETDRPAKKMNENILSDAKKALIEAVSNEPKEQLDESLISSHKTTKISDRLSSMLKLHGSDKLDNTSFEIHRRNWNNLPGNQDKVMMVLNHNGTKHDLGSHVNVSSAKQFGKHHFGIND